MCVAGHCALACIHSMPAASNPMMRYEMHAGLGVRMPVTFLVMTGSKFTFLEKLFFAIAWSPKVGAHPSTVRASPI